MDAVSGADVPAEKADGPAPGPDKTLEMRAASASMTKTKTLGEQLTLEAMDRSLQKPVDPQRLISSKVLCAIRYTLYV